MLFFNHLTDPEGYNTVENVTGLKAAREMDQVRVIQVVDQDGDRAEVERDDGRSAERICNVSGAYGVSSSCTTKVRNVVEDKMAAVDPQLRLRGLQYVRIADVGMVPEVP